MEADLTISMMTLTQTYELGWREKKHQVRHNKRVQRMMGIRPAKMEFYSTQTSSRSDGRSSPHPTAANAHRRVTMQ